MTHNVGNVARTCQLACEIFRKVKCSYIEHQFTFIISFHIIHKSEHWDAGPLTYVRGNVSAGGGLGPFCVLELKKHLS